MSAPKPSEAAQYADYGRVREAAAEVYTPEGVEVWMTARNKMFEGRTPTEMIEAGQTGRVLDLIAALADGVVM